MIAQTGWFGGHFAFLPSLYPIVNVEITNVIKATNSIMVIMHQSLLYIFLLKRYLRVVGDYQGKYLQEGNRHRFGNTKDIISRAIKSIQNQNLLDIEIILVYDFSTDNTLNIIKKFQKEDPRIKIINILKVEVISKKKFSSVSKNCEFNNVLRNNSQ